MAEVHERLAAAAGGGVIHNALLATIIIAGVSLFGRPSKGRVALLTRIVALTGLLFAALHYWPPGHG